MLRWVVFFLLLGNVTYYAWSQGLLRDWGWMPHSQAEPHRLAQQVHPQLLQLLPAQPDSNATAATDVTAATDATAAASTAMPPASTPVDTVAPVAPVAPASVASTPAGEATQCLQASGFDESQAEVLRQALSTHLPAGSWQVDAGVIAARWMVYMGRFSDAEALERKRVELRAMGIAYDRPGAALEHGLSLGRFPSQERAEVALKDLARQGIRTARVVQERKDTTVYTLNLPALTESQHAQLKKLKTALAGKPLRPCTTTPPTSQNAR